MATGRLLSPTVTIEGLEQGGSISLRVSNQYEKDDEGVDSPPADDDIGAPHLVLGAVSADVGAGVGGAFTWMRVVKAAGPSPTRTRVWFQAQQAK